MDTLFHIVKFGTGLKGREFCLFFGQSASDFSMHRGKFQDRTKYHKKVGYDSVPAP
jgi:hypothetical protein